MESDTNFSCIDGKNVCQLLDAFGNPAAPVFKVLAAVVVVPAQKAPAHAARDAVVPVGIGQADERRAGAGHGGKVKRRGGALSIKWVSFLYLVLYLVILRWEKT